MFVLDFQSLKGDALLVAGPAVATRNANVPEVAKIPSMMQQSLSIVSAKKLMLQPLRKQKKGQSKAS